MKNQKADAEATSKNVHPRCRWHSLSVPYLLQFRLGIIQVNIYTQVANKIVFLVAVALAGKHSFIRYDLWAIYSKEWSPFVLSPIHSDGIQIIQTFWWIWSLNFIEYTLYWDIRVCCINNNSLRPSTSSLFTNEKVTENLFITYWLII